MKNLLVSVLAISLLVVQIQASACSFSEKAACRPWNGTKCTIGDRIDFRFSLETTQETADQLGRNEVTFAFCPTTDELQAFHLNNSGTWGAGAVSNHDGHHPQFSQLTSNTTLKVYGMGGIGSVNFPRDSDDSSTIFYQNVSQCPTLDGAPGPAVISFLVLNVTMTNGEYRYVSNFDQGIQIGFVPTCDGDSCQFGGGICIGNPGRKNCAKCVIDGEDLKNHETNVWVSYYGTDKKGRRFLSGSNNPLNFKQFAVGSTYNTIADGVSGSVDKFK